MGDRPNQVLVNGEGLLEYCCRSRAGELHIPLMEVKGSQYLLTLQWPQDGQLFAVRPQRMPVMPKSIDEYFDQLFHG